MHLGRRATSINPGYSRLRRGLGRFEGASEAFFYPFSDPPPRRFIEGHMDGDSLTNFRYKECSGDWGASCALRLIMKDLSFKEGLGTLDLRRASARTKVT